MVVTLKLPLSAIAQYRQKAVADPGFSQGGGANPQGGAPGYDFIKFSRKLHEIEKNLVTRGGARAGGAPP